MAAWHFEPEKPVPPPAAKPATPAQNQGGSLFYGLGIAPKILEILNRLSFVTPTPIQHKAIPIAIEGKDVVGVAQTGTGKTLAFAIPVIQRLAQPRGKCLVLVPTRELAIQVDETFRKIAPAFGLQTVVLIGGAPMQPQIQGLRRNPRILIATPGRLIDHIEHGTVILADAGILVLDEADRMLDMGFMPQINEILKFVPRQRQTMLFSATIPDTILKIATAHMKLPIHIEVAPSGSTAENVVQELFIVSRDDKKQLLGKLLKQYHGSVLLFTRTKIGARKVARMLKGMNHSAAEIHSDRTLGQRKEALEGFKTGRHRILVATDIAARGIDVAGIELVINYDLPEDAENYVHRIGRTARAGQGGRAISFAMPDQGPDVKNIEKLIKSAIPVSEHPELPRGKFVEGSDSSHGRPHYGHRPQHGQRHHRPQGSGPNHRPQHGRPHPRSTHRPNYHK